MPDTPADNPSTLPIKPVDDGKKPPQIGAFSLEDVIAENAAADSGSPPA